MDALPADCLRRVAAHLAPDPTSHPAGVARRRAIDAARDAVSLTLTCRGSAHWPRELASAVWATLDAGQRRKERLAAEAGQRIGRAQARRDLLLHRDDVRRLFGDGPEAATAECPLRDALAASRARHGGDGDLVALLSAERASRAARAASQRERRARCTTRRMSLLRAALTSQGVEDAQAAWPWVDACGAHAWRTWSREKRMDEFDEREQAVGLARSLARTMAASAAASAAAASAAAAVAAAATAS